MFPFAPSCNLMYRREALEAVGGFDERFDAYDACDLNTRLARTVGGRLAFAPRALVLHVHRPDWGGWWASLAVTSSACYGSIRRGSSIDSISWNVSRTARPKSMSAPVS